MSQMMILCDVCINRYQNLKGFVCEAFPKEIPEKIATGEINHTTPFPGDNGIQFKQDPQQPILEQ